MSMLIYDKKQQRRAAQLIAAHVQAETKQWQEMVDSTCQTNKALSMLCNELVIALKAIRDIDLADCGEYVRKADSIVCEALAKHKGSRDE